MPLSRRVLVVGSGGREHALAWKLVRDGADVIVAPGNAGTAAIAENVPVDACDIPGLVELARRRQIDLTVVGPEAPLVAGIVDAFTAAGLRIFGPTAKAAMLEGSKLFCKQILHRGDVPTAMFQQFRSVAGAREYVNAREDMPVVVKADGLAAGKGVFVCQDRESALAAIDSLGSDPQCATAAKGILIEERLDGIEVSVMAITDGRTIVTLPPLQDHKAAYDGDHGPNTGGMGAYCPTPFVTPELLVEIESRILVPTLHAMRRAKVPFHGVLYAGLMLTAQGPKVLEFNARFGDPECEALLVRMESSLLELLDAAVDRRLESIEPPTWREGASGKPGTSRPCGRSWIALRYERSANKSPIEPSALPQNWEWLLSTAIGHSPRGTTSMRSSIWPISGMARLRFWPPATVEKLSIQRSHFLLIHKRPRCSDVGLRSRASPSWRNCRDAMPQPPCDSKN